MGYTIDESKLEKALEKLISEMVEKGMIQGDPSKILEKVMEGVKEAFKKDGQIPQDILTNPAEQKKLFSLIICAALETQFEKHPTLKNTFKTTDLAKAFFEKDLPKEEVHKTLALHLKKMNELKPDGLRHSKDEINELIKTLAEELHRVKKEDYSNENVAYANRLQKEMADLLFVSLYGVDPQGRPYPITSIPGNASGIPDNVGDIGSGVGGILYDENNPNTPGIAPEVKKAAESRLQAIDAVMDEFSDFVSNKYNNIIYQAHRLERN